MNNVVRTCHISMFVNDIKVNCVQCVVSKLFIFYLNGVRVCVARVFSICVCGGVYTQNRHITLK